MTLTDDIRAHLEKLLRYQAVSKSIKIYIVQSKEALARGAGHL